jgi:hypothetical protein
MSDICIGRGTQMLAGLVIVGAVGAAVVAQLPEIQRYLKIRNM